MARNFYLAHYWIMFTLSLDLDGIFQTFLLLLFVTKYFVGAILDHISPQTLFICLCLWCFWTVVLGKTLESPLDCKEIKPVNPKGNQSWMFIGRTDAEAETPILWPPDTNYWLIGKEPDAGKDWRQEKGTTEDEMVGWHHQLDGHEFEQALGVGDGQKSLVCCSPWGRKESDMTEWLTELIWAHSFLF